MYLKEIRINGFKSFANRIEIELEQGITGIVGPNGSGKSNIVDAIRWVLGEQSVKSLRGDGSMSDVIFSGSKTRNALNVASVTLVFDNSDHFLPMDYEEVAIKRRVYKDGTNEYFLNNEKCRLKDIVNILLDSGIAKEGFNIISQGRIEEILSSKPYERRIIFEEAAGVLKYKRRKEETIRKLERTDDNMNRVNDIIKELETQIEPLKEQSEKATIYLKATDDLKDIEIALITNDVTNINYTYQINKEQADKLNNELLSLTTVNSSKEAEISKKKLEISKLEEELSLKQKEYVDISTKAEQLNGQRQIVVERQKYEVEDTKLHEQILSLKEQLLTIDNDINALNLDIKNSTVEFNKLESQLNDHNYIYKELKDKKDKTNKDLSKMILNGNVLKNRQDYLTDSIENNSSLPSGVRSVLNNPKLRGIHNTIGNILEISEEYVTSITTSLGVSATFIITENEEACKEAINYLKENNLGRVTFFPLNVIKAKYIDNDTLTILESDPDYIGRASDLAKYDNLYRNIVLNQLGNVIVVKDLSAGNRISKKINYSYKIVTLDGELFHVGGSITGGAQAKVKNIITEKYELETIIKDIDKNTLLIKEIENSINELDYQLKAVEDRIYLLNKDKMLLEEAINTKNITLKALNNKKENINHTINGTNNILSNALSKEEEQILGSYYQALNDKNIIEKTIDELKHHKQICNDELVDIEYNLKKENDTYREKSDTLKNLEITINRMDVKLDNLLNTLNEEYNLTYEKAVTYYKLELPVEEARTKVNKLKNTIKDLGIVNIGAPEEYEKIKTRYDFLLKQYQDLVNAKTTLNEIISEMDTVMIKDFLDTFSLIRANFKTTFKELFGGGNADLELTDPNNVLETGIEIIASPPGKKLTSISLLSGGEKTFTAISLLFAILKTRPVSFCVLDEVEAALDDVNVVSFGNYLLNLKSKTQFIVVTHKKKTMEYADVLYGITMQESGVSKLVSVKLENLSH